MGSLVNTLTLYQHTDLRLEGFARQLSEEWDVSIFLDWIIAQSMCLQVCFEQHTHLLEQFASNDVHALAVDRHVHDVCCDVSHEAAVLPGILSPLLLCCPTASQGGLH